MGLDCSHDAFHGAYSAFNRLRMCVCAALGPDASWPPHYKRTAGGQLVEPLQVDAELDPERFYVPDEYTRESHPGLWEFLTHSDCDGELSPEMCPKVADDLEALLPKIEALGWSAGGHLDRDGGYCAVVRQFIAGCRAAAEAGEPLDFH